MNRLPITMLLLVNLTPNLLAAKTDTTFVPSDISPQEGNLNAAVRDAVGAGKLSTTVFMPDLNGRYVLTDSILVPAGERLTIVAPDPGTTKETAPPQILCSAGPDGYGTHLRTMFDCRGDILFKNHRLLYANTNGWQVQVNITIRDDSAAKESGKGEVAVFDSVIFHYSGCPTDASGAVGVTAKHFKGTFKNCYWRNCIDPHLRYYGRAVSFPFNSTGWHIDSLSFENCTFANIGYVYMQEDSGFADYVKFNHCTFLNVMMFSMESGWWNRLSVTNSVFVNTYMFGDIPATRSYRAPALYGVDPYGATLRIDSVSAFGFAAPYGDQDRRILFANSSHCIEDWLRGWMHNNPASMIWREQGETDNVPVPQPMLSPGTLRFFDSMPGGRKGFPYMNRAHLYDSTNPGFLLPPSDTAAIKSFVYHRWWDSADANWSWKRENSLNRLWPLEENLAYTNDIVTAAGMGGFPLGDLNRWWPDEYRKWEAQALLENERISYWLENGTDSIFTVGVKEHSAAAASFRLGQNYPNPFNPTTTISFLQPAW